MGRLVSIVVACVFGFSPAALADTSVDFEQYPAGTVLTDQYANQGGPGQGVVFGPLPGGTVGDGLRPVVRTPPAGEAQSGAQVADIATCAGCEFFTPRTTGTFPVPRSHISVYVGYLGAQPQVPCGPLNQDNPECAFVKLRAFDANGNELAQASVRVTRGAGIHSPLSVSTASASIVGFEISGRPMIDDSKPIAIDDLSFGSPPGPPPAPDFTLNPAATNLFLGLGGSASLPIGIGRLGGSSGDVALSAAGLPPGVSAEFAPNPAPGTQTTLTLTAAPDALPLSRTATITGTPQSASVGPAPRSFNLALVVQGCARVESAQKLVDALAADVKCIFVTGRIDLAQDLAGVAVPDHEPPLTDSETALVIPDGVTLMGDRSPAQRGGVLELSQGSDGDFMPGTDKRFMLKIGPNSRVTGLRLRGNDEHDTRDRDDPTTALYVQGGGVVIENNEIFGWPGVGVEVANTPDRASAPLISRNYIHNNVQCPPGYGVTVDGPTGFARIERNVFGFNRHHIASDGGRGPGYIAELNFALHNAPTCGGDYNQHFDVHGQHDGYGGFAGSLYAVRRNTFHGAQRYGFRGQLTRAAFEIRGKPDERAIFADNAVAHQYVLKQHTASGRTVSSHGAVRVQRAGISVASLLRKGKLVLRGNRTCLDTASELAVGDFDGDGRDDVFQAAGTLWVWSPSGRREWFYLNESTDLLPRLGLGDFDGDGRTDVFSQRGRTWLMSAGGAGQPVALPAGSPIDIRRYRFGDFDGDGKTDVFRASGTRFFLSSAGATDWLPLVPSRLEIDELRFGDFDGDGRTDVFSLANNQWSVSDGGATRWRRLNRKLSSSLGSLAFADFDGDRKTDIARASDGRWQVSFGGATSWQTLQRGRSESLSVGMLFGDFTGDGRADVLQHGARTGRPSVSCAVLRTRDARFRSFARFKLASGGASPLGGWSVAQMR